MMRAVYGTTDLPRLVVLLREPSERLHSAFYEYPQYRMRYGDGEPGYTAFVEEQIGAFEQCVDRQVARAAAAGSNIISSRGGSDSSRRGRAGGGGVATAAASGTEVATGRVAAVRRCALLFESLGYKEETVYFHTDQILRGLYSIFLKDWLELWPSERVLVVLFEDWVTKPRETLARVTSFLGLQTAAGPSDVEADDDLWAKMKEAEQHHPSLIARHTPPEETAARSAAFFAPFNIELGELMGLGPVSPWAGWQAARPAAVDGQQQQQQQGTPEQ